MRTVVLVHGAWHGAWCWAAVLAGLDEACVPTVAVDLPGPDLHGDADHVRSVLDGIDGSAVLVGHSYGGAVITDAGTHPAVERLVFLCALVPDAGESVMTIGVGLEGDERGGIGAAVRVGDDGTLSLDLDAVEQVLYADCSEVDVERARAQLRPQPVACLMQAPRDVAWLTTPTTYVVCGADRGVAAEFQRAMAARIPGASIVEWPDASHSPFLSMPGEVASLLAGLAARP